MFLIRYTVLFVAAASGSTEPDFMQVLQTYKGNQLFRPDLNEDEVQPNIKGLAFIAERSKLIFADDSNKLVRSIRMPAGDYLTDVYRCISRETHLLAVCHVPETSTLLIGERETLVALQYKSNEWREAHRLNTADNSGTTYPVRSERRSSALRRNCCSNDSLSSG